MSPESTVKVKLLIVDDEPQITRVLSMACTAKGYEIQSAPDGESAINILAQWYPDLVITDLSMPGMSGVDLCRSVRAISTVPIIVLSVRDQEKTKVEALDAGADDYVTKPFQINELLARVRSVLRRSTHSDGIQLGTRIMAGDFSIDVESRQVFIRGTEVHLTPKEFSLLYYMALHPDRVLTHRAVLTAIWGSYSIDRPESLRVLVAQLRRKIEQSDTPYYIITEPWVGYRFMPEGMPDSSL